MKLLTKLNQDENQILKIVKSRYKLKNKSEAVSFVIRSYKKYELN